LGTLWGDWPAVGRAQSPADEKAVQPQPDGLRRKEVRVTPQRRLQHSFGDGLIREEISELWEPWMRQADQILEDDALVAMVQTALAQRCKKSRTRGRPGTPADVILRLLLLKHMRDWSFEETEREVRANLVYREFPRIGASAVPDNKSISRFSRQIGPEVVEKLHQRVVSMAREKNVVQGRKLRLDTTVVETNIHYPTDSTLLNDGVRVLTRVMKKVTQVAGAVVTSLRDRTRSVQRRILEIAARQPRQERERSTETHRGLS